MRIGTRTYTKRVLALYALTIFIGLGGIVISRQIETFGMRALFLAMSVAAPLFTVGTLFARFQPGPRERAVLFVGLGLLVLGAVLSTTGLTERIDEQMGFAAGADTLSRAVGTCSVALGLVVVLFLAMRRGEDVEELSDRFWMLAEQIKEGFVLTSAWGVIVLVNRRFLDTINLPEEKVVGKHVSELADALGVDVVGAREGEEARGLASEAEVTLFTRGEERRLAVSATPIFNPTGRFTATLTTVRDITEPWRLSQRVDRYAKGLQQLVEDQAKQLVRSEERFRQLLLSMNEGFLTLDTRHRIRFVNQHLVQLLGRTEESLLDREIFDIVATGSRPGLLNLLSHGAALQDHPAQREIDFLQGDGTALPALIGVAYVAGAGSEDAAFSLVVTGVEDLKDLQRTLEERARELERANAELRMHDRAKDAFLSNVSHELRTPLSTIQGYIEMIQSGNLGELSTAQLTALRVMVRNTERLALLINEIIEFSRMEIRGVQIRTDLCLPRRFVRDAVASAQPQALQKDVTLGYTCPEDFPAIWADRDKLVQVLGILLNNAIKFTDPGGLVHVTVQARPQRTLAITIRDSGIGIALQHKEKIFEKFFQVDASMTRRYEGAGIGLSIAKSIVEGHQGVIELASEPGEGSAFTIALPHVLFEAEPIAGPPPLQGVHILMVDRSRAFHEAAGQYFTQCGATVGTVQNSFACAREAEAAASAESAEGAPRLAIVINDAPDDVAGHSTLAVLRQQPATAAIPAVVVTTATEFNTPTMPGEENAAFLIARPFAPEALLQRVREALGHEIAPENIPILTPARSTRQTRVLVIDADPGLLEWLELALGRRHMACSCATTIAQAEHLAEDSPPDIVFVDAELWAKKENGFLSGKSGSRPAIYTLTGRQDLPPPQGVAGVLEKPFSLDAVLERVREAAIFSVDTAGGSGV